MNSIGIEIPELGAIEKFLDHLFRPYKAWAHNEPNETLRFTMPWNWIRLTEASTRYLDEAKMVYKNGIEGEIRGWKAYVPRFGGWRHYVVVYSENYDDDWYLGWLCSDGTGGVSRLPISKYEFARALVGPDDVCFFALSKHGVQRPLTLFANGIIGLGSDFKHTKFI